MGNVGKYKFLINLCSLRVTICSSDKLFHQSLNDSFTPFGFITYFFTLLSTSPLGIVLSCLITSSCVEFLTIVKSYLNNLSGLRKLNLFLYLLEMNRPTKINQALLF